MKRKILHLIVVLLAAWSLQAQNNIIDEVVWVVGDEAILKSEVEAQRLQALYQGQKFNGDPYCVIPEQIAVQKLFLHQAELDSIVVTDNDIIATVDRQINYMIAQLGSKEKLEEYFGMPLSKIREQQRENAREERTIDMMKESLLENVSVTPAEVRAYFKNMPADSMTMIPAEVEIEIITIEPQYDPAEIEDIKARLRDFTERVQKGERFSTLAVLYSDCPSAKDGGELGFKGKGEYVPEFANVAFNLTDPNKVSRIVETQYGFHIIQLIEKRGDRINCRHILLRPEISATEKNNALQRLDSIADAIRNEKITFKQAVQYYSQDKDTRNNNGLLINNDYTGTSRFQMEQLPQEIGKLVYNMNVGEVSKPFVMMDTREGRNREICAIVRVKSKTKAHPASVTEDFLKLKEIVLQRKKEQIIEDWIRQKQQETYVRINENWRNCEFQYPGWIKF